MRLRPLLIALAVAGGCSDSEGEPVSAPTPIRSTEHGFQGSLPTGWELASQSLTPGLTNPVEILSAGTVRDTAPREGGCAHMPVGALERIGPKDVFVTVQERHGKPQFPERPERFALSGRIEHGDGATCARNQAELEEYWFGFRDANRGFHVLVVLGEDAPPERREEALALLDSLRFEPGRPGVRLDPDAAMASEDEASGLSWQTVPPWRRYDWPLTSVGSERLVLGTFELERRPPDENCTPRAAIDAMPPDGAFIYLFEYDEPARRGIDDLPERMGEVELGPRTGYECMGESRMARWQDEGRVFQAHVYVGPRASEATEREARSILNSIQVRDARPPRPSPTSVERALRTLPGDVPPQPTDADCRYASAAERADSPFGARSRIPQLSCAITVDAASERYLVQVLPNGCFVAAARAASAGAPAIHGCGVR